MTEPIIKTPSAARRMGYRSKLVVAGMVTLLAGGATGFAAGQAFASADDPVVENAVTGQSPVTGEESQDQGREVPGRGIPRPAASDPTTSSV